MEKLCLVLYYLRLYDYVAADMADTYLTNWCGSYIVLSLGLLSVVC